MIELCVSPARLSETEHFRSFQIAGQTLLTDIAPDVFAGFERERTGFVPHATVRNSFKSTKRTKHLYRGPGWIGNAWRDVNCWLLSLGYEIDVAGIGTFWISEGGDGIILTKQIGGVDQALIVEAALGPGLILALAQHGVWCWHASAVLINGLAIAFLGESGKGKSTLAHWLGEHSEGPWRRVADDIMPVAHGMRSIDILPHFPQLKIPNHRQPAVGLPQRVPLAAVYVLSRPVDSDEVGILPLGAQGGALALIRHTVASRLFDPDLLAKQLDFCVQTAADIPVRQLIYPLQAEALPLVEKALRQDFQSREVASGLLAAQ